MRGEKGRARFAAGSAGRIARWVWNGPEWRPLESTPRRRPTLAWWLAAAAYAAVATLGLVARIDGGLIAPSVYSFHVAYATLMAAALFLWWRRPATRMGPLLAGWPIGGALGDLVYPFPDSRLVTTGALGLTTLAYGALMVMYFVYPAGRPFSVWGWRMGAALFLNNLIWNAGLLLFFDARGCPVCAPRAPSYLYLGHPWDGLGTWHRVFAGLSLPIYLPVIGFLVWRWLRASPGARRALLPFTVTSVFTHVMGIPWFVQITSKGVGFDVEHQWYAHVGRVAFASAVVMGIWSTRRSRRVVADLVVDLDRAPAGGVRDALARALGDPSAQLALWLPDRGHWADHDGTPVALPTDGSRAVTMIGDRLAAIVHDNQLADQQDLLRAIGSAGRLALENERLHAELKAQLAELRRSRARIVSTADTERRKLERDLHDGAQQRLLAIGMALQLLDRHVDRNGGHSLLLETRAELDSALAELRELARGLHPAILTDHGLAAAIRTLAERTPIPVELDLDDSRHAAHIETAAYYTVAEALTNITRHADATRATIHTHTTPTHLQLTITDDGKGGADLRDGTGLRGLQDRIGALDGTLHIASPAGEGTTLTANIPLNDDQG